MNRLCNRILGLTMGMGSLLAVHTARADDPVTGPDLNSTKGKPLDPPAPTSGVTPKLVGVSAFAGVAVIDMGPVNDRLETVPGTLYPKNLPILFPILGGQGFGLFNRFRSAALARVCCRAVSMSQAIARSLPAEPGARSISVISSSA